MVVAHGWVRENRFRGGKGARHAAVRREYGTTYQDVLDKGDGTDGSFCKRVLLSYSEGVDK